MAQLSYGVDPGVAFRGGGRLFSSLLRPDRQVHMERLPGTVSLDLWGPKLRMLVAAFPVGNTHS
jgi:hypothetical protein